VSELSEPPTATAVDDRPPGDGRHVVVERTRPSVSAFGALDWSQLALAVGTLVAVCASLYLAVRLFTLPQAELDAFLSGNTLDAALRKRVLLQLFAAMALPLVASAVIIGRFRADGLHWLTVAADRLAPLLVACFVPTLLNFRQWYSQPLPYLVLLAGVVLLLERLLWRAFGGSTEFAGAPRGANPRFEFRPALGPGSLPPPSAAARYLPLAAVVIAALGYAVHASYYTIMRHQLLGTAGFDLGIFDNLMFNALHGRPFKSTVAIPDGSYLSNHAEYGMFLFAPLYALRPGADTLLILQSTFMGFAAIPLYFFACTQLPRPLSAAIACVYVFFAPMQGANYYDFHWMPQSMLFFFWMFYAIATGKRLAIALLTIVICSIREDAAFGLIATGIFLVITGFRPLLGVVLTGVSVAWFVLVKFVIMPWAGPWWFADIYKDLVAAGESGYGSVVKTILVNPNYFIRQLLNETKATYTLHLLAPLAFLSVRHPALWVLMLPGFAVTLMTTGYAPTTSITFQYTTHWVPFLFAAAVIALRLRGERLGPAAARASVVALCFGVLCHSYVFGSIFQHKTFTGGFSRVQFEMSKAERQRYKDLLEVAAKIPKTASVAATELEIPHVSTRLDAYTLKVTAGDADYLLLARSHLDDDAKRRIREASVDAEYGLVVQKNDFYLLKRNHTSPGTPAALAALGMHRLREKPQHHDSGSIIGPGGNCVSVELDKSPDTLVKNCAANPDQRWVLSLSDLKLKYKPKPELCLAMPKRKNYDPLRALPCDSDGTTWTFESTNIHNFSEKCVDQLGGNQAPGAQIGVWECLQNPNQGWTITKNGEVRLGPQSGSKCWTMRNTEAGSPLELRDCDRSPSQRFTFSANKIRFGDKCLDLRSDKPLAPGKEPPRTPRNGWFLQLHPCSDSAPYQEFHFAGQLAQRGKCMDSLMSRTADGSSVGVYECLGNNNQQFDLHF
jgi:uncharacterized membrane protein